MARQGTSLGEPLDRKCNGWRIDLPRREPSINPWCLIICLVCMIRVEMCREYGPSDVRCNSLQVIPEGGP